MKHSKKSTAKDTYEATARKVTLPEPTWAVAEKRAKELGKTIDEYFLELAFVEMRDRHLGAGKPGR